MWLNLSRFPGATLNRLRLSKLLWCKSYIINTGAINSTNSEFPMTILYISSRSVIKGLNMCLMYLLYKQTVLCVCVYIAMEPETCIFNESERHLGEIFTSL